jgi:hypothetical protein
MIFKASSGKSLPLSFLVLLICLALIIGFIGPAWLGFLPSFPFNASYNLGLILCHTGLVGLPYYLALIIWPILNMNFVRKKIDKSIGIPTFIACLYTLGISIAYPLSEWWTFAGMGRWIAQRYNVPEYDWLLPEWMVPPRDVVEVMITGGPIHWEKWLSCITFFWIFQVVFAIFSLSIATIFRKQWIDIEKVPFPHTLMAYGIMERTSGLVRLGKIFALGVLIGLALQFPITLAMIFPWFPDIYGWRVNTCGPGMTYITPDSPLAIIVGLEAWNKQPLLFVIAYLAPLSTSFSVIVFFIVDLILTQVTYTMGYYTGLLEKGGCGRCWCPPTPFWSPPLGYKLWSFVGGSIGITLMQLFLSRRYIIDTIKAAFGRGSKNFEEGEPVSYRTAYLMLFTSILAIIVFCMVSFDMSLFVAILMPITVFIFWFSEIRINGLSGIASTCGTHANVLYRWFVWPTLPDKPWSREFIFANGISAWHEFTGPEGPGAMGSIFSSFMSYKMASLTNVNNRDVFKLLLLCLVLSPLATIVGYIWVTHAFGLTRLSAGGDVNSWSPAHWVLYGGGIATWPSTGSIEEWTPPCLFGIFMVIALSLLRSRFVWFPLEPVGFWVAFAYSGQLVGMWLPFMVSWALKLLTLRIGGSKAYEEVGVPIATGVAAGCFISILFGAILGITRFFIPF